MSRYFPSKFTVFGWIKDIPELRFDNHQFFCSICDKSFSWTEQHQITQHISSEIHKNGVRALGFKEEVHEERSELAKPSRFVPSTHTVYWWIKDIPELRFVNDEFFCSSCNKSFAWTQKSQVMKHVSSQVHINGVCGDKQEGSSRNPRNFNLDLLEVMVGCSISWKQLDSPLFREFLQNCLHGKYSNIEVPHEAILRKRYLPLSCDNIKEKIISELDGKHVWVSVGETNACGRKVTSVIVGGLHEDYPMRGHLIASKVLVNSRTVADLIESSLRTLWGDNYAQNSDKFLLFITDSAPYMAEAAKKLQETHQDMLHVTCLAHGLREVEETITACFPNVDKVIREVNKLFEKAPDRVKVLQEMFPNVAIPPLSEAWLEAANYYYSNFDSIKLVLQHLDPNQTTTILQMCDSTTKKNLAYICANFSRIPLATHELERKPKADFKITDAMNVVFDLRSYIYTLTGDVADTVKHKLEAVLASNPGFTTLSCVVKLLDGQEVDFGVADVNVACSKKYTYFKYAPVTSVAIERSFNENTGMFSAQCRNLTPDRLEQVLIINFYSNGW